MDSEAGGSPPNCTTYGKCSKTLPPFRREKKSTTTQIPRTSSGKFRASEATIRINPRLIINSGTSTGRSSDSYTPYYTPTIFSVTTRKSAKASGRDNSQKATECVENEDCLQWGGPNSVCRVRTCRCKDRYLHNEQNRCHLLSKLGENCAYSFDCASTQNAKCSSSICTCKEGFVQDKKMCLPVVTELGKDCNISIQCNKIKLGDQVACEDKKCQCTESAIDVQGKCLSKKGMGEICNYSKECSLVENMMCKDNNCTCKDNFLGSVDKKKCLPMVMELSGNCTVSNQCNKTNLGDQVKCQDNKCQCTESAIDVQGKCLSKKGMGEECSHSKECSLIGNMTCKGKICTCQDDFLSSADRKKCLRRPKYIGESCEEHLQCHESFGRSSYCLNVCTCRNDFHAVNGTICVLNRGVYESCTSDIDCYDMKPLRCNNGKCTPLEIPKLQRGGIVVADTRNRTARDNMKEKAKSLGICISHSKFMFVIIMSLQFLANTE
ncbi:prion-like-(Q/N-rich) domain-bearing protein 25 [Periplaneta americana]|uniref:prion-like-(Q/N-rich) domain-bearing protein 25 n=1 Tax=Periplaneta americana TaxID=6978 RepID=UPI0037E7141B